jgi:uncharacterized membrane protein
MTVLSSLVAWVHIATVVVAIGGAAFVLLMLRPLALRTLEPPIAGRLMGAVQARFRWVQWAAIVLFIVTGIWSAVQFRGMTSLEAVFDTAFGRTLLVKSILALLLFANALAVTLPLRRLAWFRQRQPTIIAINLVLAAIIVLLASFMVRRGGLF